MQLKAEMLPFTLRVNCGFARVALVRSSEDDFKSLFQGMMGGRGQEQGMMGGRGNGQGHLR